MIAKNTTSGFTLIEMIVVISIIMILMGVAIFPYGYYMQRGYSERSSDGLHQEWILAHQMIRGGLQFDTGKHAGLFIIFEKGRSEIQSYLLSGSTLPDLDNISSPDIRKYKTYSMDDGVQILGFTGSLLGIGDRVGYLISPPRGDGVFFTGNTQSGSYLDARVIIGYPGADISTGRSREVLLRPYLR